MAEFYSSKEYNSNFTIPDYTGYGLSEHSMFKNGRLQTNSGPERIEQSIRQILVTPKGVRFFVPNFGSMLYSLVNEPNDFILSDLAILYAKEAIRDWEPRVEVTEIQTDYQTNPQVLYMNIIYKILSTNRLENFVYALNREIKSL